VPIGTQKKELLEQLDQVPTHVQQLQFTVKNPTVGKAATFTKVDSVINEDENFNECYFKGGHYVFHMRDSVLQKILLYLANTDISSRSSKILQCPVRYCSMSKIPKFKYNLDFNVLANRAGSGQFRDGEDGSGAGGVGSDGKLNSGSGSDASM
ncbi:Alpha-catulin, partial [Sarracenia purpurea var. burkii]